MELALAPAVAVIHSAKPALGSFSFDEPVLSACFSFSLALAALVLPVKYQIEIRDTDRPSPQLGVNAPLTTGSLRAGLADFAFLISGVSSSTQIVSLPTKTTEVQHINLSRSRMVMAKTTKRCLQSAI